MVKENVKKTLRHEVIVCDCANSEHSAIFSYFEDEPGTVYFSPHLKKLPFLKRLWYAIRYILGRQSCYGAFDEFIFTENDIDKFKKIVKHLKK